jgi:hypothetical protein
MDRKAEILKRIQNRMDEDEEYAEQLSDAVESNDWDWVESLIESVFDFVVDFAAGFLQGLIRSLFR